MATVGAPGREGPTGSVFLPDLPEVLAPRPDQLISNPFGCHARILYLGVTCPWLTRRVDLFQGSLSLFAFRHENGCWSQEGEDRRAVRASCLHQRESNWQLDIIDERESALCVCGGGGGRGGRQI